MNNPDLQKWLLAPDGIATRLRALRGNATGKDFAAAAGMRASKLSKLELAQQEPTADDIRAIVNAAGEPAKVADDLIAKLGQMPTVRASARVNRFGQVATQKRLNQLLANASTVRLFEATYMPRPLQTVDYATAVLAAAARAQGVKDESSEAAPVLASSSQYLHQSRRFEIVIAEPVLRWQGLPAEVMRAQLKHLIQAMTLPGLDLRVLPLDTPLTVIPPASFGIVDTVGYADTLEGAQELTEERLVGHAALMDELLTGAAEVDQAREFIDAAIARLPQAPSSI
jgi:transcriptional regulator with XRE-family HTH domain